MARSPCRFSPSICFSVAVYTTCSLENSSATSSQHFSFPSLCKWRQWTMATVLLWFIASVISELESIFHWMKRKTTALKAFLPFWGWTERVWQCHELNLASHLFLVKASVWLHPLSSTSRLIWELSYALPIVSVTLSASNVTKEVGVANSTVGSQHLSANSTSLCLSVHPALVCSILTYSLVASRDDKTPGSQAVPIVTFTVMIAFWAKESWHTELFVVVFFLQI